MEITERPVQFVAPDGAKINGILTTPPGKSKHAVVLLHGITTNKNEYGDFYAQVAASLAQHQICSLRIDFRGHGDSEVSSREFSVSSQVLDTISAVRWLSEKTKLKLVNLIGCSFGCPPAIFSATMWPELIGSVYLICPVLDYDATFLHPKTEWAKSLFNTKSIKAAFTKGTLKMTDSFSIDVKLIVEMQLLQPYSALSRLPKKCVIVHGMADSMVPFEITKKRAGEIKQVQIMGIPGMDHGYIDCNDEAGTSTKSQQNYKKIIVEAVKLVKEG